MSGQHMPARIWVRVCGGGVSMPSGRIYTTVVGQDVKQERHIPFIRADLAERMAEALETHQLWEKREKEGPLYPRGMKRDDPGGEEIWRAWWNDQLSLCSKAWELTDAALSAFKDAGQ